jgi:DNA-binding NtrC family response regulator
MARTDPSVRGQIPGLVYVSDAVGRVARRIASIAQCDATVLIQGETGTGKEVCAQAVHYFSGRSSHPWVALNCGAVPSELVEDELFGHVKGAYTTAIGVRTGLVREAEGGTLFLDDVDCLPLTAQAKLLRFMQEREYRPVGSNHLQHADVRVLAASNRDLRTLSEAGGFRLDLYYRLSVLRLSLPPLRERREDIPLLARHFTQQFARQHRRDVVGVSAGALQRLLAHDWPGNVRELRNTIERAVLLAPGSDLTAVDIELDGGAVPDPGAPDECPDSFHDAKARVVRDFERGYLELVLSAAHGNVAAAARAAKKDRRAFFELMRKHSIDAGRFRQTH